METPVLIVGAGLAGLALAQILRQAGVPYRVFERDQDNVRKQGWAVMLAECLDPLLPLLPNDLGELRQLSVNCNTDDLDSIGVVDAKTMEILVKVGGIPPGNPGYGIRASREKLRQHLWQKIEVELGKKFERYEQDPDGVTAFFADGTSARGSLLVGADGSHSRVRKSLLHDGPILSKHVSLIAECEVPPECYKPLREIGNASVVAIHHGYRILIGQHYLKPDLSLGKYYYILFYKVEDPEKEVEWIASASKQDLYEKVLEVLSGAGKPIMNIINFMGSESMGIPPIKSLEYVSPESLPPGRVTLVGDALHTMLPFKAAGANTALRDVCDLGKLIIDHTKENKVGSWDEVLKQYHAIAVPRGRDVVLSSRANGDAFPFRKP